MHVKRLYVRDFKRFTDLTVEDLPPSAKLVVVTGANGSGKSALIEVLNTARRSKHFGLNPDDYFAKTGSAQQFQYWDASSFLLDFHEGEPSDWRSAIWVRTAYRHQPDLHSPGVSQMSSPLDSPGTERLTHGDPLTEENYRRLVTQSLEHLYDASNAGITAGELVERLTGALHRAMLAVFEDLELEKLTDPLNAGTFFFSKGASRGFPFKNLSSGERAAFDLLLDMVVRTQVFTDTVYCIDEPELHLGTRAQGRLLDALVDLLPDGCQLWIATHSPGMLRAALRRHERAPAETVFLDTFGHDFDAPVVMRPISPTREFWRRALDVALDDLAGLIAPEVVVLCEGGDVNGLDAQCYRTIFASTRPAVEFVSVGNSNEVVNDRRGVAAAVQVLAPGTRVISVVDRDDATPEERERRVTPGTRMLNRRNIESYLLSDDALRELHSRHGDVSTSADQLIAKRDELLEEAIAQGHPCDDFKRVSRGMREHIKRSLRIPRIGSDQRAFLVDIMSPCLRTDSEAFADLEESIFGTQ